MRHSISPVTKRNMRDETLNLTCNKRNMRDETVNLTCNKSNNIDKILKSHLSGLAKDGTASLAANDIAAFWQCVPDGTRPDVAGGGSETCRD